MARDNQSSYNHKQRNYNATLRKPPMNQQLPQPDITSKECGNLDITSWNADRTAGLVYQQASKQITLTSSHICKHGGYLKSQNMVDAAIEDHLLDCSVPVTSATVNTSLPATRWQLLNSEVMPCSVTPSPRLPRQKTCVTHTLFAITACKKPRCNYVIAANPQKELTCRT